MTSLPARLKTSGRRAAAGFLLGLWGCGSWAPIRRIPQEYARLEPSGVTAEIDRWERAATETPAEPRGAEARLRLALLYSHPHHPAPDHRRALEHLEAYAEFDPVGARDPWAQRLRSALEAVNRCTVRGEQREEVAELRRREEQEVRRRLEALQQRSRELQRATETLARENQNLKETLERLKELDLRTERLRSREGKEPPAGPVKPP